MSPKALLAIAALIAATWPAAAQDAEAPEIIEGRAVAYDGDTIAFERDGETVRVRLFGIDTPEMRTPNGPYARAYLDELIAGATIACTVLDVDRYKRPVARCAATGPDGAAIDLSAAMTLAGWATSYRVYSTDYDAQERAAIAARRGIWAGLPVVTRTVAELGWYEEIKDWGGILAPTIAIVVGGLLGFRRVHQTQVSNAELARERAKSDASLARKRAESDAELARDRDEHSASLTLKQIASDALLARAQADDARALEQRRRRTEARTIARVLAAELRAGAKNLQLNIGAVLAAAKTDQQYDRLWAAAIALPPIELFQTHLPNIGLLGELAGDTVTVYDDLQRVRRYDEDMRRDLESGDRKPFDITTVGPELRWGQFAERSTDLADRLDAYDPPDDI